MNIKLYSKEYYAIRPTKLMLYLRTCLAWQLIRFIVINIKMSIMIIKSHDTKIEMKGKPSE